MSKTHHHMLAWLLPLVALAGCASSAESLTLQHTRRQPAFAFGAQDVGVKVQVNDQRNYLAPGTSRKWGRAVVGYARNQLGEEIDPQLVVVEPVEVTFKKAVEGELGARGVRLEGDTRVQLVIEIDVFFNDFKVGLFRPESIASLAMNVTLLSNEGKGLYARRIATQGRCPGNGTNSARTALDEALDDGIETLFGDREFASALSFRDVSEGR